MPSRRDFMATIAPGALVALGAGPVRAATTGKPAFRAGSGRADIVFPSGRFPIDGFTGQHDPLAVRIVLLDDGTTRLAIVVVDLTSISGELITAIRTIVTDVAGIATPDIIVSASHTFSAPHIFAAGQAPPGTDMKANAAAWQAVIQAARQAATRALASLQPARLGAGQGTSRVSVNRDVRTPYGWWLGADDAGDTDPTVSVLRIDRLDGRPLAIMTNFAVQSSVMDGSVTSTGGRLVTADLAGAAMRHVEARYGPDAAALFMVGAAGDQAPYLQASRPVVNADGRAARIDIHEAGFAIVDLLGARLGAQIVDVTEQIRAVDAPTLDIRRESIQVASQAFSPRTNRATGPVTTFSYDAGPPVALPVVLVRIGDLALVGVQPELAAGLGARIRAHSPFAHTMVATMVDGGAKYMPDARSYDRHTYEARSSPFARGAGEAACARIVALLKQALPAAR
ncbi:neutral/alkaline non-lysosomal ceramidase N-terminal domain-containing protein [Komagataeibacter europaeus]|nr:neutral/alkaline non-lysosomal ceramidase N-terminal domain-containing protein [Komagataeibacter europaeus]